MPKATRFQFLLEYQSNNSGPYPPLIGGMRATVSPSLRGKTSPAGTYSSFNAKVMLSSSITNGPSLGYVSANTRRKSAVLGDDDDDDDVDNNTTGTFFSSSSSFFSRPRAADAGASQTFSRFTTFWKSERNRWNKASKQFASELNAAANRTAENVHHTLNQANEAIEQGMRSLIDHARDAIEEGTSVVREVNVGEGEYVYSSKRGLGAKSMEGFHKYLNDIISNITSVNLIAGEIPDFGGSQ
mmetsp:Transcript_28685/g.83084  ORF Transcript_28685/g.83084 Transcript_28685/m.83084 type:complete len:242 (+) Transcript_28685:1785-2510(+)